MIDKEKISDRELIENFSNILDTLFLGLCLGVATSKTIRKYADDEFFGYIINIRRAITRMERDCTGGPNE